VLEFLAELLAELLAKFFLGLVFFDIFLRNFSTFSSVKNLSKLTKHFWPNRFLDKKHMDKIMFENLGPEKSRSRKKHGPGKNTVLEKTRSRKNHGPGNHKVLKNRRFCHNCDL